MADDGMVAASQRPVIFSGTTYPRIGRLGAFLAAVCGAGIVLVLASQTVLARYVYYRAEDLALAARKELRQTVDTVHNWWHHVNKTVAQRDRRRAASATMPADTERWVGTIDDATRD
jgi:uncharacterized membrane protein